MQTTSDFTIPRSFYLSLAGVSVLALCLFMGIVYLLDARGGNFVRMLSGEVGEVLSARAENLANAGHVPEAIAEYERALTRRFDNPRQKVWTMQKLAKLLLRENRPREAAIVMRRALALDDDDGWNYGLLAQALQYSDQHAELLGNSDKWFRFAESVGNKTNMMLAQYYKGLALARENDSNGALEAFLRAHTIEPAPAPAINAARLLVRGERYEEATPLIEYVIARGEGNMVEEARALLAKIARSSKRQGG